MKNHTILPPAFAAASCNDKRYRTLTRKRKTCREQLSAVLMNFKDNKSNKIAIHISTRSWAHIKHPS